LSFYENDDERGEGENDDEIPEKEIPEENLDEYDDKNYG